MADLKEKYAPSYDQDLLKFIEHEHTFYSELVLKLAHLWFDTYQVLSQLLAFAVSLLKRKKKKPHTFLKACV